MPGGVGRSGVDVSPVHGPAGMTEHLIEEDALAAAVAIAERVHQCQLGPVRGDGVGGCVAVRGAGWLRGDLAEDPVELNAQELRSGVGESEGASTCGAEFTSPVVDVLENVVVDRLEVGEVESVLDRAELELDDSEVSEIALVLC